MGACKREPGNMSKDQARGAFEGDQPGFAVVWKGLSFMSPLRTTIQRHPFCKETTPVANIDHERERGDLGNDSPASVDSPVVRLKATNARHPRSVLGRR